MRALLAFYFNLMGQVQWAWLAGLGWIWRAAHGPY